MLVCSGSTSGIDKIPTLDEYKNALKGDMDLPKKMEKIGELNELAYEVLILLINNTFSIGKVAFGLGRNAKNADFPKKNSKIAWDRLVSKYALCTTSHLLKLKSKFNNSKLDSMEKDLDEWISNLEGLQIWVNEFVLKGNITDADFMNHILNNLHKEYYVIHDGLENYLMQVGMMRQLLM